MNVTDLPAQFDSFFKTAIAAELLGLGTPVETSQIYVVEKANKATTVGATTTHAVVVKAYILAVGDLQDSAYFTAFLGLFAESSGLDAVKAKFVALGTIESSSAEKAKGAHLIAHVTFLDHPLSTFDNAVFKAKFASDLKIAFGNFTEMPAADVTIYSYAAGTPADSTEVTLYVAWLKSEAFAVSQMKALVADAEVALPFIKAEYGNITATSSVPRETKETATTPPVSAAIKADGVTSVLFSMLAAGVLAQLNRNN